MQTLLFYCFAALVVISAVMVVSLRNPVHSVLFLIFAFFNTSGIFILLGAEYIAMTLVIVYVGAVAVLFLFVIMMMDIDFATVKQGFVRTAPLILILAAIVFAELVYAVKESAVLVHAKHHSHLAQITNTQALGERLYTEYFIAFQLSGLVLLVAMIGAIVLTISKTTGIRRQDIPSQVARKASESLKVVNVKVGEGVEV